MAPSPGRNDGGVLAAYRAYLHRSRWWWLGALVAAVSWAFVVADSGPVSAAEGFAYTLS